MSKAKLSSDHMTISELAELADVNLQTIRYYENLGLIPEPERSESGYRLYHSDYVEHIKFVKNTQDLGFKLDEIQELVNLRFSKKARGADVKEFVRKKIFDINTEIAKLEKQKKTLEVLDQSCSGEMKTSCCPIIESLRDGSPLIKQNSLSQTTNCCTKTKSHS